MSHHEKVLMIAALLLAHGAVAEAAPVTVTIPGAFSAPVGSFTVSFAPITNADELISISLNGSVIHGEGAGIGPSAGEGGTFTLDVDYVGGAPQPIFTTQLFQSNTLV